MNFQMDTQFWWPLLDVRQEDSEFQRLDLDIHPQLIVGMYRVQRLWPVLPQAGRMSEALPGVNTS